MAQANDLSTLNGFFKESYSDKLGMLIPDGVKLLNKIMFESREKQPGNQYHAPVVLGLEHGVTFGGPTDGAFTLNDAVAGVTQDATVRGNQMVLRSVLSYSAASRSLGGGKKAFEDATKFLVANMVRSMAKKLEIELLYGQSGYGEIASVTGAGPYVCTIKTAEWAPGIWAGGEGMPVEWSATAGGAVAGSGTVTAVSLSARTVTIALVSGSAPVANDDISHKGASGKEFAGIHKILTNTSTLFGIDASAYNLWKGNQVLVAPAGPLSFDVIQQGVAKAVEKGLDSDVIVLVNPSAWTNLMSDMAASRRFDSSFSSSKMENGSQAIKFFGQCGAIEIEPSIYIKEGYAYVLCMDEFSRIGSTDVTFKRPGQGDQFFRDLENAAGYELRAYTDQALFCSGPGKNCLISDIVNS
jgi:hypothetical protein